VDGPVGSPREGGAGLARPVRSRIWRQPGGGEARGPRRRRDSV